MVSLWVIPLEMIPVKVIPMRAEAAVCVVIVAITAGPVLAQSTTPDPQTPASQEPPPPAESPANPRRPVWYVFKDIATDFAKLPSVDTVQILALGGAAAAAASAVDQSLNGRLKHAEWFGPGRVAGDTSTLAGVAAVTYVWGRVDKSPKVVHIGVDLIRAQIVTAGLTWGLKAGVARRRPDGGRHSFPSGHSSVTFTSATVLQRHFGWKGAIAYSAASYVAVSRLHENRHYLSDVVFGAAIGTVAGRTVTRHGRDTFTYAVAPTRGGVMVIASRKS
jgi:membrane-associated phospholipid phosphatase